MDEKQQVGQRERGEEGEDEGRGKGTHSDQVVEMVEVEDFVEEDLFWGDELSAEEERHETKRRNEPTGQIASVFKLVPLFLALLPLSPLLTLGPQYKKKAVPTLT